MSRKRPQLATVPKGEKLPGLVFPKKTAVTRDMRFRFNLVDLDSQWCLTQISLEHHRLLLDKLRHLESMTMHEVFSGGPGKDYDPSEIVPEAQRRLTEKALDDRDFISRLSLGGTERLYGFRDGNEFSIVWWDPSHEICPSVKKHT